MTKKRCVLFGSSGDIGNAILSELDRNAFDVVEVNRNKIGSLSYEGFFSANETYDSVIISLGIMGLKPIKLTDIDFLQKFLDTNFLLPAKIILFLIQQKLLNDGANIVVISSISGQSVWKKGTSAYSASKAALNSFVRSVSIELKRNCTINALCPGMVESKNTVDLTNQISLDTIKRDKLNYPMGYISTESVARYSVFLATEASNSQVNGTLIEIDGGHNYFR
jgi:NAD(P)-dependent dehydrogenase (short-subunit alcohol dehydrogenase family)